MSVRDLIDLGISGLRPLPFLVEADRWRALHDRLHAKVYLRSEGLAIELGPPQKAHGALLESSRDVSRRFAKFYAHAARAYFDHPALRPEFLLEPLIEPLVELDAESASTTPLARLDCVLDDRGKISVVEINPIGGNLYHLRGLLYLIRGLHQAGMEAGAEQVDQLTKLTVRGFEQYYKLKQPHPVARPRIGVLTPKSWLRASTPLFRAAFERHGWNYVYGDPSALTIDARGVHLHGEQVDLLWSDFLFQMAYQHARYQNTKWPTKIVDFSDTPSQAAAILANPLFREHVRSARVVSIGPGTAFLGLSKSLLAWIHDPERPCPPEDRTWLAEHTARTYSVRERRLGVLTREQAIDERTSLLIKPCQYGGSHGVEIGRDTPTDRWTAALDRIWDDDSWVVQRFHEPARVAGAQWVSLGLQTFDGVLGGIYVRLSPSTIISARDAAFVPVVVPG